MLEFIEKWARRRGYTLEEDKRLPKESAILDAGHVLRYGPGTDLELMMFHFNLTAGDRRWLRKARIAV